MSNEKTKSTKRFLIIYSIAIFIFAIALILFASFSQARIAKDEAATEKKFKDVELAATTKIDELNRKTFTLEEENKTLLAENTTLKTESEATKKKLAASQALVRILNARSVGDDIKFRAELKAFETAGYVAYISPEEIEIYTALKQ